MHSRLEAVGQHPQQQVFRQVPGCWPAAEAVPACPQAVEVETAQPRDLDLERCRPLRIERHGVRQPGWWRRRR